MSTTRAVLAAVPLMLLFPVRQPLSASQPEIIGPGCTTAFFIDKDCSGYGVGVKSSGDYPLSQGQHVGTPGWYTTLATSPMPMTKTRPSIRRRSGRRSGALTMCEMVRFLKTRKTFSNTSRIFYLSQTGSDSSARINDPRRPFRTMAPILTELQDLKGGAVIIRGGTWTDLDFNPCPYSRRQSVLQSQRERGTPGLRDGLSGRACSNEQRHQLSYLPALSTRLLRHNRRPHFPRRSVWIG